MDKLSTKSRIGIMSAMQEEMQALLNVLVLEEKIHKGSRDYFIGTLFNTDVVLVFSRWGKVASSVTATQLINDFNLSQLIFTGVAGSIDSDVKIGDLVLASSCIQHDMDASPLFNKFHIPILDLKELPTENSEDFIHALEHTVKDIHQEFPQELIEEFNLEQLRYHRGLVLSGDQFISESTKLKSLKKELPEALCVEMEGAAIAQVCYEYELPFTLLRIISDHADDNAHIDFPRFANKVASEISLILFRNLFINKQNTIFD
ncbi:MAG: 5'-methylthioadenosine/adenosylhomocysteine nucleosidase [Flavobacteriaceae bacterium]